MTVKSVQKPQMRLEVLPDDLPTFPLEVGYRYVYNPASQKHDQVPLTLLEFLYPIEEDVGAVVMPESPLHDLWTNLLAIMLRGYLSSADWLVISDVLIHWGQPRAPAKAPDLAAIPGGRMPAQTEKSYRVERDGPIPAFALEITSEETRQSDLYEKTLLYAAVGVREMLVIDILSELAGPWQLLGYRLEDSPFYREIEPDADGGLTFETIGLRFVAIGRERIEVYEAATGERLLTPDELKARAEVEAARAEAEATRAEAEATARAKAEARAAQLEAQLRELQARYGLTTAADEPTDEPGEADEETGY